MKRSAPNAKASINEQETKVWPSVIYVELCQRAEFEMNPRNPVVINVRFFFVWLRFVLSLYKYPHVHTTNRCVSIRAHSTRILEKTYRQRST